MSSIDHLSPPFSFQPFVPMYDRPFTAQSLDVAISELLAATARR